MRKAHVYVNGVLAGVLEKITEQEYRFMYVKGYHGEPVSLTMPITKQRYDFDQFPPFFEGLLPEGMMLEGLLRKYKLDRRDLFGQLMLVGQDMVGAVSVEEIL